MVEVARVTRRPLIRTYMAVYRYGRLIYNVCGAQWGRMERNYGIDIFTDDIRNIAVGWHLQCGTHFIPAQHIGSDLGPDSPSIGLRSH
ncbi:hypothetical protein ACJIZ3_003564 [Penstemon smallii]|uniref:Uncharacterized protein n=1 Tax=Penstemon smallii TaxID=265156 RepID=A0ABD3UB67_9LAMI